MRILIVEDDMDLCGVIQNYLKREGYAVDMCHNGGDALYFIRQNAYDLILLDRMLPEKNGMELLRQARADGISAYIILATALNGIGDRITGLDAGADDYIAKPYDMEELLARVRAISRRPLQLENRSIQFEDITLDLTNGTLQGLAASRTLSNREAALLEIFLRNPHKVLPRAMLIARVWGPETPIEDGNLDNYIHFLRRRLQTVSNVARIRTARSVGYALESAAVTNANQATEAIK